MTYRIVKQFSLCLIVALSGCAQMPWQKTPTADVEQLREQHRYVSALKALDAQKKQVPDYAQQRARLLDEARDYRSELIKESQALMDKQQFAQADAVIESARSELPASKELSQFDEQFSSARERYMQRWLDELTVVRASSLAKEHAAYQALQKAAIESSEIAAVERHQADVDYFAPLIANMGTQALAQNDYVKAAQYLSIANQLAPSPALAKQLKTVEQAIVQGRQKQQAARISEREQRYRDLHSVLQKSLQEREFFAARDLLAQAKALNTHSEELDAMQRELDDAIAAFVAQQIDAGNRQYADGHIEAALQRWRSANELTPTSELKEKIDKAQKFIDRLEQLRKSSR